MAILTDYARNMLGRALCGRAPALPSAIYAALGTSGAAAGLGGEPAGNGYARQRITFTGNGLQRNVEVIRFAFSAAAGTLTHIGLYDAVSGGNPLVYGPLAQSAAIVGPGTLTVAAEALTIDGN